MTQAAKQLPFARQFQRVFLCAFILMLAGPAAWGKVGRSVYANGRNYKVYLNSDNYITVSKGYPASGYFHTTDADTVKSPYKVCRTYNKVPGESLAVFNNKLFYAYTADSPAVDTYGIPSDTSCSAPGKGKMSVWVAAFDLNELVEERWVSNRALGQVAINYQTSSVSGAAITVFANQLYLFADSGIWTGTETSTGGIAWAGPHPAFMDSHWEPLDAVTIFPPNTTLYDGPRILIVYGLQAEATSTVYHINAIWGATWNGKWGADQRYFDVGSPFPSGTRQYIGGTVSLTPGTASFSGWGAKEAAVQLFLKNKVGSTDKVQHIEFTYGTSLGLWRVDPTAYGSNITDLNVFLNSQQECFSFLPAYWDLRQQVYINWIQSGDHHAIVEPSDALAPQTRNIPILNCGDPGGAETDTAEADPNDLSVLATRQHYWTLVGVILGAPPFAQNGYTLFSDLQNFANVNYGLDNSHTVDQTQSMSNAIFASSSTEVHAGLNESTGVKVSLDLSYKHAWESSHGTAVSKQLKVTRLMGTQASSCTELGKWGWALFMAPRFIYQDWKAYAYDYSTLYGTGSPLNVDMHTLNVKDVPDNPDASFAGVVARFELANPGGPNDDYPGLMTRTGSTGAPLPPFASSLNTKYWSNPGYTWRSDARWETKLGEGSLPLLQFTGGLGTEASYTSSTQSFDSEGETTDVSLRAGVKFGVGTKFNGMSETVTVGYDGSFKTSTKTTTGFGEQVQFLLKMKSCNYSSNPYCVSRLSVQPYWLLGGAGAPWIPDAFKNQKPWAITWKVTDMTPAVPMNLTGPIGCPPPPLTPSWLTATAVSSTQIDLAWENVAGETAYSVERSTDGGTTWEPNATTGVDVTTFSDTGLTSSTTYRYRVMSVNSYGFSAPSAIATATTLGANARSTMSATETAVTLGANSTPADLATGTSATRGDTITPTTSGTLNANNSASSGTGIAGGRFGTSLPPVNASGRAVSGMGGGLGGEPYSHYAIEGGRLAWFLNGAEERIPMTAGDFDAFKGVSVQIQELSWSLTSANGTWTRSGEVWTFEPRKSAEQNRVSMKLDFGSATYNLDIQKVDLSGRVPAGTAIVRVLVTVNDLYMFYTDLQHDIDIAWRWSLPAPDASTLHVTSMEGRYNSATQSGKASIAGTLPADLPAFGDVEVNVNEHPYLAQLVGREDFQQAVQSGGTFKHAREGLILLFDFGSKTWSMTFNGKAFHNLLVPQVGVLRTRLSVGGVPWYRAEDAVLDYSANLTLSK